MEQCDFWSLVQQQFHYLGAHGCAVASRSGCVQRAWALLQGSSDGVSWEHSLHVRELRWWLWLPFLQKRIAAVQWWIELCTVVAQGTTSPAWKPRSAVLGAWENWSFLLFSLEHTPRILSFLQWNRVENLVRISGAYEIFLQEQQVCASAQGWWPTSVQGHGLGSSGATAL